MFWLIMIRKLKRMPTDEWKTLSTSINVVEILQYKHYSCFSPRSQVVRFDTAHVHTTSVIDEVFNKDPLSTESNQDAMESGLTFTANCYLLARLSSNCVWGGLKSRSIFLPPSVLDNFGFKPKAPYARPTKFTFHLLFFITPFMGRLQCM